LCVTKCERRVWIDPEASPGVGKSERPGDRRANLDQIASNGRNPSDGDRPISAAGANIEEALSILQPKSDLAFLCLAVGQGEREPSQLGRSGYAADGQPGPSFEAIDAARSSGIGNVPVP